MTKSTRSGPQHGPESVSPTRDLPEGEGGFLWTAFAGPREAGGKIRLGAAVRAFVDLQVARGYSPATLKGLENLRSALYRLGNFTDDTPLASITPAKAGEVLAKIKSRYGPRTAWSYSIRILALFRTFTAGGLILENPFAGLDPHRKPHLPPGEVLSRGDVKRLLAAAGSDRETGVRDRALLEVLYSTGLRTSECARLEGSDVDFAAGTIRVRAGKGGKDRRVPLGRAAAEWLRRYLGKVSQPATGPLWTGRRGPSRGTGWIAGALHRAARRAGIPSRVTVHVLRRTCASHLLAGGASAWVVKELLGHADSKTLSRYLRIDWEDLRNAHEKTHPRR